MRHFDIIFADALPETAFSNGSEYEWWAMSWCDRCIHDRDLYIDGGCPIAGVAFQDRTPREWTKTDPRWNNYTCSEFWEDQGDDGPQPPVTPEPDPAQDALDGLLELSLAELPQMEHVEVRRD